MAFVVVGWEPGAGGGAGWPACVPEWRELAVVEREHCAASLPRLDRYAGRLAAKRSVRLVAHQIAGPPMLSLRDVVIVRSPDGRPQPVFRGSACDRLRGAGPIDVSIAHRSGRAIAFAASGGDAGVDVVERSVVERADDLHVTRLAQRVLTLEERCGAPDVAALRERVLTGLTAKECVGKLLKRSHPSISWHDVTIESDTGSPPEIGARVADDLRAAVGPGAIGFGRCTTTSRAGGAHLWVTWLHTPSYTYAAAYRAGRRSYTAAPAS